MVEKVSKLDKWTRVTIPKKKCSLKRGVFRLGKHYITDIQEKYIEKQSSGDIKLFHRKDDLIILTDPTGQTFMYPSFVLFQAIEDKLLNRPPVVFKKKSRLVRWLFSWKTLKYIIYFIILCYLTIKGGKNE